MFVQVADDMKVDAAANTLRLVKVGQQTLYFSDRPVRIAGHLKMSEFLDEWTSKAGKDNFGADPPNAVLSVYEPGQADSTLVVVEISHPKVDGADLVYNYKVIKGKLPAPAVRRRCSSTGSVQAAAWGPASTALASAGAAPVSGRRPN